MKLEVRVEPDFKGYVQVIDQSVDMHVYQEEDIEVVSFEDFKFTETCTIDILTKINVSSTHVHEIVYTDHINGMSDSIMIPLKEDGYYGLTHIVLPTKDWAVKAKQQNIQSVKDAGTLYYVEYKNNQYIIKKIFVDGQSVVDMPTTVDELVSVGQHSVMNPLGSVSISQVDFNIFCIDKLKQCYKNAACEILDNIGIPCNPEYDTKKFNRDFLWMTINVINIYLEEGMYGNAQQLLENIIGFNGSYRHDHKKSSCGCRH